MQLGTFDFGEDEISLNYYKMTLCPFPSVITKALNTVVKIARPY